MASDFITETRREVLSILGGDPTITQTHSAKVYSAIVNKPEWPWLRWGEPSSVPLDGACVSGAIVSFTVHVFAREREIDGKVTQSAEDYCSDITAAVKRALHLRKWGSADVSYRFRVQTSRLLRDPDDNRAFHGVVQVASRVVAGR